MGSYTSLSFSSILLPAQAKKGLGRTLVLEKGIMLILSAPQDME